MNKTEQLEQIANELRRMIQDDEAGEVGRNLSAAVVYIDCARFTLTGQGKYRVVPLVVTVYEEAQ